MSRLDDPRVFFAAERTLLAWSRTSLTLMGFGFVIERFGLFVTMLSTEQAHLLQRDLSFWIGTAFIALGIAVAIISVIQYRAVLRSLREVEFPAHYWTQVGVLMNVGLALLGAVTIIYLFRGLG